MPSPKRPAPFAPASQPASPPIDTLHKGHTRTLKASFATAGNIPTHRQLDSFAPYRPADARTTFLARRTPTLKGYLPASPPPPVQRRLGSYRGPVPAPTNPSTTPYHCRMKQALVLLHRRAMASS
ncbi:hypothetical protein HBI81_025820 [Parastagonospora nodorum]|nr:hypothetical protein HBI81_025820 [Parastagonospora nodorum]